MHIRKRPEEIQDALQREAYVLEDNLVLQEDEKYVETDSKAEHSQLPRTETASAER